MSRILLLYASTHGQTRKIAEAIAVRLRDHGGEVELVDATAEAPPAPWGFDAVVIGSRVHSGKHAQSALAYIQQYRVALAKRPVYFFSVSNTAADKALAPDPGGYIARAEHDTGWRPFASVAFAGGLPYRAYNPILRLIMKWISRRAGQPSDTSRDHELTDWGQVVDFADLIARGLASVASSAVPADLSVSRM